MNNTNDKDFRQQLISLINRHSKENESDTPDFILAEYLIGCLKTFNLSLENRKHWYRKPTPEPKQRLFTTEDGVEIFPGDKYWVINFRSHVERAFEYYAVSGGHEPLPNLKYFSTEKAANEYVKQKKEPVRKERIAVKEFWYGGSQYCFTTSKSIFTEKFPLIKQAIEKVLNEDEGDVHDAVKLLEEKGWLAIKSKEYYSQQEQAERKAFESSRMYNIVDNNFHKFSYSSFEDFKKQNP